MTIRLPKDLETSVKAAVRAGGFATPDEAMAEACRAALRDHHARAGLKGTMMAMLETLHVAPIKGGAWAVKLDEGAAADLY